MRDLDEAQALGIDVSDIVVVTHPSKTTRGGHRRRFQMPYMAYVKRGMEELGFEIEGRAVKTEQPKSYRERELEAELERVRQQLAEAENGNDEAEGPDDRRAELVAEAETLGLKVHPNAKDETIERKIAEARAVSVNAGDEDFD